MFQDEYPKCFNRDNNRFEIYETAVRWYQGPNNPESPDSNYFKVETTCRQEFFIKHDLESYIKLHLPDKSINGTIQHINNMTG